MVPTNEISWMRAARLSAPLRPRQSDAAEQVVAQEIRDESQEGRDEQIAQHQPVERQIERVEAEVLAELRVGDSEVAAVKEQLDTDPVALGDDAGQQRR